MPQVPAPAWSTKSTTSTKSSKSTTFAMFPRLLFHDRRLPPNPSPTLLPHDRGPTTTRRYKISFTPHGQGLPPKKASPTTPVGLEGGPRFLPHDRGLPPNPSRTVPLACKAAPGFCAMTGGRHHIRPARLPLARRYKTSFFTPHGQGLQPKSVPDGSPWPGRRPQASAPRPGAATKSVLNAPENRKA